MRTILIVFLSVILSVTATLAYLHKSSDTVVGSVQKNESAYDRVMRTGVLRCGYATWPVFLTKDFKTGKVTGMFADMVEAMAAKLRWKVDWVEDVGWGGFIEALKNGRIDMFCAAAWPSAERGLQVRFSVPVAYSAVDIYARAGDMRFDHNHALLNDPSISLATIDGEMSSLIAATTFPQAQRVALTGTIADPAQLFENVATGKADATFAETSIAKGYAQHNPGKIRKVTSTPYAVFADAFPVALDEEKLAAVVNVALGEMLNNGDIDRMIERYEPDRSVFLPVAKPYTYTAPAALP